MEIDNQTVHSGPTLSFGPEDLKGVSSNHNDALVIRAMVANYDVARIFVDSGSSVNVLFQEAINQMDLGQYKMEPVVTSLFGFTGHAIRPVGLVHLPLTLGKGNGRKTRIKMKFPVGNEVGEVQGDQVIARKCYVEEVRIEQKVARTNSVDRPGISGMDKVNLIDDTSVSAEEEIEEIMISPPSGMTLKHYKLKLNPSKCTFGVRVGKFLGYMVTRRGIEANPEKVQAIISMSSPKNIQEVKRLTGRITALPRFISRSADKSLPFFEALRKKKNFEWNEESEKSFQDLKAYLKQLPVLNKPTQGEALFLYFAVTPREVSLFLVRRDGTNHQPIYFVSHALKGAKLNYLTQENLALALVITARKLRPYFFSHPITVLTNSILGKIATNPDASGRLIRWIIELSEYDIRFEPRTAIKAQALADFLAETVQLEHEELWKIFVDGSSCKSGSGAEIVIISPWGEETNISIRLDFRASNNEAEYEALLLGLKAARNLDGKMLRYAKALDKDKEGFTELNLELIPRTENIKADHFSRLASALSNRPDPIVPDREIVSQLENLDDIIAQVPEGDWRYDIYQYLTKKELPSDNKKAREPLLKCLGPDEPNYVLREIHEGSCGIHLGSLALARKALLAGFFWPTMRKDSSDLVNSCYNCQRHANLQWRPAEYMKAMVAACPFDQWGMDICAASGSLAGWHQTMRDSSVDPKFEHGARK
ncbi:uncharacterized protein [Henckelia pumila]|uniref:uncharacterized protein n=1 Tax=Henckelia pumila TaxID=405737 RepID=UPI003C6E9EDF